MVKRTRWVKNAKKNSVGNNFCSFCPPDLCVTQFCFLRKEKFSHYKIESIFNLNLFSLKKCLRYEIFIDPFPKTKEMGSEMEVALW